MPCVPEEVDNNGILEAAKPGPCQAGLYLLANAGGGLAAGLLGFFLSLHEPETGT